MEAKIDQPLVSVIIPVYNAEAYLERCLNSVLDQSYDQLEIILVDDGSLIVRVRSVILMPQPIHASV